MFTIQITAIKMATVLELKRKNLMTKYFNGIKNGDKTCEGRYWSEFWNDDLIGKTIIFFCNKDDDVVEEINCKITHVNWYEGETKEEVIKKMLVCELTEKMLYPTKLLDDGIKEYLGLPLKTEKINGLYKMGSFHFEIVQ